jgi:2-dehydro-3-deoxyphosphooctonate aldolase (KDO 8-P synthase)
MMQIGAVGIGDGEPLALIAGLNVIETLDRTLECAAAVQGIADHHGLPLVFKASFDKANRSSRF